MLHHLQATERASLLAKPAFQPPGEVHVFMQHGQDHDVLTRCLKEDLVGLAAHRPDRALSGERSPGEAAAGDLCKAAL